MYDNFMCDTKRNFHQNGTLHTDLIKHNIVGEKLKKNLEQILIKYLQGLHLLYKCVMQQSC